MARTVIWWRAWHGRFYDLGRMALPELWGAWTCPAIRLYAAFAEPRSTQ